MGGLGVWRLYYFETELIQALRCATAQRQTLYGISQAPSIATSSAVLEDTAAKLRPTAAPAQGCVVPRTDGAPPDYWSGTLALAGDTCAKKLTPISQTARPDLKSYVKKQGLSLSKADAEEFKQRVEKSGLSARAAESSYAQLADGRRKHG